MAHEELEQTRVYVQASEFADSIWNDVLQWRELARDTVGKQFARAADSIGSNIAESYGPSDPTF
jgi:four helix bundle protein